MIIEITFSIDTNNYEVPWKVQHELDRLRIKLKKYILKKQNGTLIYNINQNNHICDEVISLKKKYSDELLLETKFDAIYSKEELEKACLFIPNFNNIQLEEYADDNMTHIEICEHCGCSKMRKKLIANPDGKTKLLKTEDRVIKCGEEIDVTYGISKHMFDNISNSYLRKGFREIFSKNGKEPFGYVFWGNQSVKLYNDNHNYDKPCEFCGSVYVEEKQDIDCYCDYYVKDEVDFKDSPVVYSEQFFYGNQVALICPQLYMYIKEKVENAEFIPVFKK